MPEVFPKFIGGVGNQLFILASAKGYAEKNNFKLIFNTNILSGNPHCSLDPPLVNLFPNVERKTIDKYPEVSSDGVFGLVNSLNIPNDAKSFAISGYCQNVCNFPSDGFRDWAVNLPDIHSNFNYDYSDICFLHVRRTDYVGNTSVYVDLDNYWKAAVGHLIKNNPNVKILILSDDLGFANSYIPDLLKEICQIDRFILNNRRISAMETIKIMSECKAGAICANSTLSWWGAWLNIDRPIYMPVPWSSYDINPNLSLYFKGVYRVDANTGEFIN